MSMQEARAEFLGTIKQRARSIGETYTGGVGETYLANKSSLAALVEAQLALHRQGKIPNVVEPKDVADFTGRTSQRVGKWFKLILKPESYSYWKKTVHTQTHAHAYYQIDSDRTRAAAAASGGLSTLPADVRKEISLKGLKARRDKYGPPATETLLPLFLRGLSNQDLTLFTPYPSVTVSSTRVELKRRGLLSGEGPRARPKIEVPKSPEQYEDLLLLRRLYERGLFGTDLTGWKLLHKLSERYTQFSRPEVDLLRLEVFCRASAAEVKGQAEMMKLYVGAIQEVDTPRVTQQIEMDKKYYEEAIPFIVVLGRKV